MTDLFSAPQTTGEENPNKNFLEELVGEGKKFKTPEELARGKAEADAFIKRLQDEAAGLRQELSTRQTLEQLMDKMAAEKGNQQTNQQSYNQDSEGGEGTKAVKSITEEDIARLVEERLSTAEKTRIHNSNLETVRKALESSLGSDYVTHLKAKAAELGVSEEYLSNMAKETPKAFLKLVEVDGSPKGTTPQLFSPPPTHGLPGSNNKGFSPTGQRKQSWYENLRKSNPTEYWSPATQNRMHQEAQSLGEAFFDI